MSKERARKRAAAAPTEHVPGVVDMAADDLVAATAAQAKLARGRYDLLVARTVTIGRREGWSWDRLGALLDTPGETLRRRHGDG